MINTAKLISKSKIMSATSSVNSMSSSHDNYNKNVTSFTISFDTTQNNENLQEAFKKYREYKIQGNKLNAINDANWNSRKNYRSNPERMARLRAKFIENAKEYFGVPYAKKYFPPESPEYHSKLFLDCCGLVRKVMRNLENDFGFRIGPGNQAYMFDTLPINIENLKDVKPGDLVFIQAIYYNPKMKKQPHNVTHVEIMLGDGTERTIGARWNNGKVQVFDSYKFESKSYHSQKYTFKSIDPWLLGLCKSYCHKHSWRFVQSKHSKHSIFSADSTTSRKSLKTASSTKALQDLTKKTRRKKKKKKRSKSKKKSVVKNSCQLSIQDPLNTNQSNKIDENKASLYIQKEPTFIENEANGNSSSEGSCSESCCSSNSCCCNSDDFDDYYDEAFDQPDHEYENIEPGNEFNDEEFELKSTLEENFKILNLNEKNSA